MHIEKIDNLKISPKKYSIAGANFRLEYFLGTSLTWEHFRNAFTLTEMAKHTKRSIV